MNNLDTAANLLEDGSMWCTTDMIRTDVDDRVKVCLLGAIHAAKNGIDGEHLSNLTLPEQNQFDSDAWDTVYGGGPEFEALAKVIGELNTAYSLAYDVDNSDKDNAEEIAEVIYSWNDEQESVESVVEVLRLAASRLEK